MAGAQQRTIKRALVATLALYALVVSGFVAGLGPISAMPIGFGAICTHQGRGDAPPPADTNHALCCVLACAAVSQSVATLPSDASVGRPDRTPGLLRWGAVPHTSPPARFLLSLRARGPPAV